MASGWQQTAFQEAQVVSERLRDLLTAALAYLNTERGIDLGLQPKNYPWWVFLAVPALLGLLLFVVLIRAAGRGSAPKSRAAEEKVPAPAPTVPSVQPAKSPKPEDPKKKAKKKTPEKAKPNGRPVELVQEEVITAVKRDGIKQPTEAEKKNEKNKKNKKKLKSESKPTQSTDKKESEEGNWETKISNREKRQQRKRDKGADDLSEIAASIISETFISVSAPPAVRKAKGSSEVSAVNGNTWNEKPAKLITAQVIEEKWVTATSSGKKKADPCTWNQEASDANGKEWSAPWSERSIFPGLISTAPWSAVDGRVNKSEPRPQSFSTIGLNNAIPAVVSEPVTHPKACDSQWDAAPAESNVDDEWSGLNGLGSADPSSDWNAPAEVWGNYDEEEPATSQTEEPDLEASKVSDNEKGESATQNSSSGKTKKKKKKKKQGEESGSPTQDAEGVDEEVSIKVLDPEAPSQAAKSIPINAGKANEPKKTSEQKKTNEQKKNEPKKPSDVKKTSEPKTNEQKKSEQKTSDSKKAGEQKTSDLKKTSEQKTSDSKKASEQKTSDSKKASEQKTSDSKKAGEQKTNDSKKAGEQKTNDSKKAGEQKTSEPKKGGEQKANEPKKTNEHKKTSEQKKKTDGKKSEEEIRSFTVLAESPVLNTLTEKSSSKQTQEKNASVNKQNIVPPPLQGKAEENWESPKQQVKKKKARRET